MKPKRLFNNPFIIRNSGAFLAQSAKNRAIRSNLFYRFAVKKDFRSYPLRAHQRYTTFLQPDKGFAKQRQGLQKCGGGFAWEWSVAIGLAKP
jgi:hypothetical protein